MAPCRPGARGTRALGAPRSHAGHCAPAKVGAVTADRADAGMHAHDAVDGGGGHERTQCIWSPVPWLSLIDSGMPWSAGVYKLSTDTVQ